MGKDFGVPKSFFYMEEESVKQYLGDIYDSIILKDIVTRYRIRDVEQFKRMLMYLISNIGNVFSAANITKYMKSEFRGISTETLYNYKEYYQVAYLLASEETVQREFGAFRGIDDNFPKFVLSLDEFDFSRDGYQHLNIRDFLLKPA